jgi:predicted  nucleic acid-binding Zn-ribbon protein
MVENVGTAQAREFLAALHEQVAELSQKLENAERRHRRTSIRGAAHDRRRQNALRQELHEAHRLIDGLHRRFPEALHVSHGEHGARALSARRTQ